MSEIVIESARSGKLGTAADQVEQLQAKIADCSRMLAELGTLMTIPPDADVATRVDARARAAAAEREGWQLEREREGYERALPDARRRLAELRQRRENVLAAIEACHTTIAEWEPEAEKRAAMVTQLEQMVREAGSHEEYIALSAALRAVSGPADRVQTARNDLIAYGRTLDELGNE